MSGDGMPRPSVAREIMADPQGAPEARATVLILHGILASKRAWRSLAARVAKRRPELDVIALDLRGHGDARGRPGPHTLDTCARDLWAQQQSDGPAGGAPSRDPAAIIGHSFGGKVALAALRYWPSAEIWCLDSDPTPTSRSDSSEVERVLATLDTLPAAPTRAEVTAAFAGFGAGFAAWMTTNLEPGGWRFEREVVRELLASYRLADFTDGVRSQNVHLVRGERSDRWSPAGLALCEAIGARAHVLANAGHWLHVDAADALVELLTAQLVTDSCPARLRDQA